MKTRFWTSNHQQLIDDYLLNEQNRKIIITKLTPIIIEIIERAASKLNYHLNEDDTQDTYIHIITRVIPKLTDEKKQAALNYIYLASRNYLLSEVIRYKKRKIYNEDILDYINNETDMMVEIDNETDRVQEARKEIIKQLDIKIGEVASNRSHVVFLLLMKHHLIENNFDIADLQEYICTVMKIKTSTFNKTCYRIGIKGKIFNQINKA